MNKGIFIAGGILLMNILVTGAYGNIGRPVIYEILKRNHEITVFEKKSKRTLKAARKYK